MATPTCGGCRERSARELVHGAVKLCGLTRVKDVLLTFRAGATHAGFIFVPGTPRALTIKQAAPLVRRAHGLGLATVGVFRDADAETILAHAAAMPLDAVQLHGCEDGALIEDLRERLSGVEIITARGVTGPDRQAPRGGDRTLFDTAGGGTGTAFDWTLLVGDPDIAGAFLAGGIRPANAAAAKAVGVYGLDVSSAVESAPGIKDPGKVRALFDALRPKSRGDV
jgi:indole-3-glycerol phosphate synthase/phosphoribosylanthranilate isomerase